MLSLAFGTIRTRLTSFVGAFVAVLLCAMMVTAAGVMLESAIRAKTPVERLDGTDFAVAASTKLQRTPQMGPAKEDEESPKDPLPERSRIPADLAGRIASVSGVGSVVVDRTVQIALPGGKAADAHGWSSAALTPVKLTSGRAPVAPNEIAAAEPLGAQLKVTTPQGVRAYTVVGTLPDGDVFLSDREAEALTGLPGQADFIGVLAAPGADQGKLKKDLKALVKTYEAGHGPLYGDAKRLQPKLEVKSGGGLGAVENPDGNEMKVGAIALSAAFGGNAAFVAIFVVAGAFGFSIQQRTREIGMLRAIGAAPKQIRRMVACEALLVALAASVAGAPLGLLFAKVMKAAFDHAGVLPAGFALHNGWIPALIGVGAAVLTTQLAGFAASFRSARVKPTEVVAGPAKRRVAGRIVRYLLGLAAFVGGIVVTVVAMNLSGDAAAATSVGIVFCFMGAAAFFGPELARLGAALLGRLFRIGGGAAGELAHANSAMNPARISAVATPIMLCIAFTCAVLFTNTITADQTDKQSRARTTASYILGGPAGLPAQILDDVREVPGVTAATGTVATEVFAGSTEDAEPVSAHGVDTTVGDVLDLGVTSGSTKDLTGDTVALSTMMADGKKVGDTVKFWLGDGTPVSLKVVALYKNALGFGDYLIPRDMATAHTTGRGLDAVYVKGDADQAGLLATGAQLIDRGSYLDKAGEETQQNSDANASILGVIALFIAVGVVNTLIMATGQRSREFALLRLIGTSRRQIASMVRREAAVIAVLGIGVGTAIAWVTLGAFANALGAGFNPVFPPVTYLAVVAATGGLIYLATLIPARAALRKDPVTEIGARD